MATKHHLSFFDYRNEARLSRASGNDAGVVKYSSDSDDPLVLTFVDDVENGQSRQLRSAPFPYTEDRLSKSSIPEWLTQVKPIQSKMDLIVSDSTQINGTDLYTMQFSNNDFFLVAQLRTLCVKHIHSHGFSNQNEVVLISNQSRSIGSVRFILFLLD